jgi:hypothetical protein
MKLRTVICLRSSNRYVPSPGCANIYMSSTVMWSALGQSIEAVFVVTVVAIYDSIISSSLLHALTRMIPSYLAAILLPFQSSKKKILLRTSSPISGQFCDHSRTQAWTNRSRIMDSFIHSHPTDAQVLPQTRFWISTIRSDRKFSRSTWSRFPSFARRSCSDSRPSFGERSVRISGSLSFVETKPKFLHQYPLVKAVEQP